MEADERWIPEYVTHGMRELCAYLGKHAHYARECALRDVPPYIEPRSKPRSHSTD